MCGEKQMMNVKIIIWEINFNFFSFDCGLMYNLAFPFSADHKRSKIIIDFTGRCKSIFLNNYQAECKEN